MFRRRQGGRQAKPDPEPYQPKNKRPPAPSRTYRPAGVFTFLLAARVLSAAFNITHDCDEVYNYWEPLHYLLYGYGMQTWEYSAQYALRSYLYLLMHASVAAPAAVWLGPGAGKVYVYYITKAALGAVSAGTEARLYSAACKQLGPRTGNILLLLLAAVPGLFFASTALLPSSFAMYCLTAAAAFVLEGRPRHVALCAIVAVVWGWPVAGVAFAPYAVYVLFAPRLLRSILFSLGFLAVTICPLVAVDRMLYGTWTVSLLNFIKYNVVGGGDSALYGTEGPLFYVRNGLNNVNIVLVLTLVAPLIACLQWARPGKAWSSRALLAVLPAFVWLAVLTALPHKEERFLYVTYPLMCLVAAAVLAAAPGLIVWVTHAVLPRTASRMLANTAGRLALALVLLLSASRIAAVLGNYSAPMRLYRHLPPEPTRDISHISTVCVGAEWHRFPSAFFLPSPAYRLAFIPSSFSGLLPVNFDVHQGGTAASPASLNDRNQLDPANVLPDTRSCDFLVTWLPAGIPDTGWDESLWDVVAVHKFVDAARSRHWLARALYIPWFSARHNHHVQYALMQRRVSEMRSWFG